MFDHLAQLGWKPVFQQQLDLTQQNPAHISRVVAVQRTGLAVLPEVSGFRELPLSGKWFQKVAVERPTVGDWVLVDPQDGAVLEVLERTSEIKRLAPDGEEQLIAANIDTAFVVTSANADFNLSRLERYLSVLDEAGIQAVVVLTKIDEADDIDEFADALRGLPGGIMMELVDARVPEQLEGLRMWCGAGQSVALLGSSGVGKSTLVNSLSGEQVQLTKAIRATDDKGRHTTTHRSLHLLPEGGVILDSPGMREFQITDSGQGVSSVFRDIEALAEQCRFNDCAHATEPGCAVQAAVEGGELDPRRLQNYFKLLREDRYNTETIAERKARGRQFNKMVRQHNADNPKLNRR